MLASGCCLLFTEHGDCITLPLVEKSLSFFKEKIREENLAKEKDETKIVHHMCVDGLFGVCRL